VHAVQCQNFTKKNILFITAITVTAKFKFHMTVLKLQYRKIYLTGVNQSFKIVTSCWKRGVYNGIKSQWKENDVPTLGVSGSRMHKLQ